MKKETKLKKNSPDIAREKLAQFKKLFPEAVAEGKIDIEALRRTIGEELAVNDERYTLNWAGKNEAFKALQTPTMATLAPCPEESVDFEKTGNVFIEGENLEVLKVLQKAYYGKIKMIYIDPPYNTGSDSFIYPDRFQESKEEYLKRIEEKDEEGYLMKEGLFRKNSKENGHYHSNWLSMMYPRLFLARNLLKEDGVIFISIDDNEVHNLRLLMNEIFGEENFVGVFVWRKKEGGGQTDEYFVTEHEYILVYRKTEKFIWIDEKITLTEADYRNSDDKGKFALIKLEKWGSASRREDRPTMYFSIKTPDGKNYYPKAPDGNDGRWRVGKKRMEELGRNNLVYWNEGIPYEKAYYDPAKFKVIKERSILYEISGTGDGTNELTELFGVKDVLDNPKPTELIKFFILYVTNGDSMVLDFFAGSGTTGHYVLSYNATHLEKRQFICVQLSEATKENSVALKQGYSTIAEIGKERIRRVIKKLKAEGAKPETDLGFKVFKLKNSNFKIWRGDTIDTTEDLEKQMDMLKDPVKPEAQERNLLWELILKSGYDLNTSIEERKTGKSKYFIVAGGEMVVLLSKADGKCLQEIINHKPQKVICLDSIFEGNDQLKTNTVLQMKDAEIEFRTI